MRIRRLQAAVIVLLCFHLAASAGTHPALARSKPGPADERGVAVHVGSRAFTLRTASHGSFHVVTTPDTSVTLKGKRSPLREGDHVGVQGFRSGRTLRAIWVHIYSRAAPKPFSVPGTVTSISARQMSVQTGSGVLVFAVSSSTPVVIGRAHSHVGNIRTGDRVLVRAQRSPAGTTALHIHVYRSAAHQRHVSLTGTVVSVAGTVATVRTASGQVQVRIPPSAVVYIGSSHASGSALHAGEHVRVYACCAGAPLTATSIHIRRSRPHVVSEYLHGTVLRLEAGQIVISIGGRSVTVITPSGTEYEIASAPASREAFRRGDEVTVRAHVIKGRIIAVRIDVPASARVPRTIIGTVTSVARSRVVVSVRGRRYTLDFSKGSSVTLGGHPVAPGALRVGDKIHARGIRRGTTLAVSSLSAVRPPPVVITVRGTVTTARGSSLVIVDAVGARHPVRIAPGVHPIAHGSRVPASIVFPGVHATAKGTLKGSTLLASSLLVSVVPREISGILVRAVHGGLRVKAAGRLETVDLGGNPVILDAGRHIAAGGLKNGAFLDVKGYAPASYQIRATRIRVLHPALDITGTFLTEPKGRVVRTSAGEIYRIYLGNATEVSNARAPVTLTMDDVPSGTRVRVTGTARSDGSIAAATIVVQLSSVTLRGTIANVSSNDVVLSSGSGEQTVRLDANAGIQQGARPLQLADLVTGDDVTVTGYAAKDVILARTLQVHRPLVGLDGVVQATGSGGITLSTTSGIVRVVVGPDTQITGSVAPGSKVHVTGYRRGDGVVLATRIRAGK